MVTSTFLFDAPFFVTKNDIFEQSHLSTKVKDGTPNYPISLYLLPANASTGSIRGVVVESLVYLRGEHIFLSKQKKEAKNNNDKTKQQHRKQKKN